MEQELKNGMNNHPPSKSHQIVFQTVTSFSVRLYGLHLYLFVCVGTFGFFFFFGNTFLYPFWYLQWHKDVIFAIDH